MPPEVRERIFEPFYTTKPPGSGTGLGLHIAHNVVGRHGGRIEVRSRPGETCFEVVLPIERRAGSRPAWRGDIGAPRRERPRIPAALRDSLRRFDGPRRMCAAAGARGRGRLVPRPEHR